MKLSEAIESGKRFKRPEDKCFIDQEKIKFNMHDLIRIDWEVEEIIDVGKCYRAYLMIFTLSGQADLRFFSGENNKPKEDAHHKYVRLKHFDVNTVSDVEQKYEPKKCAMSELASTPDHLIKSKGTGITLKQMSDIYKL